MILLYERRSEKYYHSKPQMRKSLKIKMDLDFMRESVSIDWSISAQKNSFYVNENHPNSSNSVITLSSEISLQERSRDQVFTSRFS